jgi:hypothetical protein
MNSENPSSTDTEDARNVDTSQNKLRIRLFNPGMWTAIFTGIVAVFTYQLVKVTGKVDETTRSTQRAFVNFQSINGVQKMLSDDAQKKWVREQFSAIWVNSGTTPATNGAASINYDSRPHDARGLEENFDFPDGDRKNFVIGPKGTGSVPMPVTITALDSVRLAQARLFMWGWVTYNDIFPGSPRHLSEFCVELTKIIPIDPASPDFADPTSEFVWQTSDCKMHNCYDRDCSDYDQKTK